MTSVLVRVMLVVVIGKFTNFRGLKQCKLFTQPITLMFLAMCGSLLNSDSGTQSCSILLIYHLQHLSQDHVESKRMLRIS